MKYLSIILFTAIVAGCASTSELEAVNAKVSALETKIDLVAVDAASAKSSADVASAKAVAAEDAANRAAKSAQDISAKLDRLFRKAQLK